MASPSPFKALFSKQTITASKHLEPTSSSPSKKSRLRESRDSKPAAKGTTAVTFKKRHPARLSSHSATAVLSADHDTNSLGRLFSLLAPMSTSSPSSSPTMLLPPAALFPALTATASSAPHSSALAPTGPKRQKPGLFSKIKKPRKQLLDDHHSTSTTTSASSTKGTVSHRQKGAWSSIFRRDNDTTAIDSQPPWSPSPERHLQTTTVPVTHRKVGTGLQFGQIWRSKDTADMGPSLSISSDKSSDNDKDSRAIAITKKTDWLSIPSSTPTDSSSTSRCDHCQRADQLKCQQRSQLQRQRSKTRFTFAVQDVFGIGRMSEMAVALLLAHDCFLCRKPLWLQCAILLWEGVVVLVVLWAVLRVIGLAEVIVWGADDIVRGSVSLIQAIGQALRIVFWR
ncbi:MAG: hypothetical protein J3R72DRAFT_459371 [Linnemannia gamsii]|nr:MAG: hypothetical protein J3R72DRAFT_459371 [Linnemannia gamsii]